MLLALAPGSRRAGQKDWRTVQVTGSTPSATIRPCDPLEQADGYAPHVQRLIVWRAALMTRIYCPSAFQTLAAANSIVYSSVVCTETCTGAVPARRAICSLAVMDTFARPIGAGGVRHAILVGEAA